MDWMSTISDATRLIVCQPNYRYQHAMLSDIVVGHGGLYVRFDGMDLDEDALLHQLELTLSGTIESVNDVQWLILDECDRADNEALNAFLMYLLDNYLNARIMIISRHVPTLVIEEESISRMTEFVPVDGQLMLHDVTQRDAPTMLEVHAFGQGRAYINGVPVAQWDGVLPRLLFFFLVDKGIITRDRIFDVFWPDMDVKEATNVFHVTKRKVNEILSIDLTAYSGGFYRISPNIELRYDVLQYTDLIQHAGIADDDDAIALLTKADQLYQGSYLQGMAGNWICDRRNELQQMQCDLLCDLANLKNKRGEWQQALGLYSRALMHNRTREDIVARLMSLYIQNGFVDDALHVYDDTVRILQAEVQLEPGRDLRELADMARNALVTEQAS